MPMHVEFRKTLIAAAQKVTELERRNDYGGQHKQAEREFDEAGGFLGWRDRKRAWRTPVQGMYARTRAEAIVLWARATATPDERSESEDSAR